MRKSDFYNMIMFIISVCLLHTESMFFFWPIMTVALSFFLYRGVSFNERYYIVCTGYNHISSSILTILCRFYIIDPTIDPCGHLWPVFFLVIIGLKVLSIRYYTGSPNYLSHSASSICFFFSLTSSFMQKVYFVLCIFI